MAVSSDNSPLMKWLSRKCLDDMRKDTEALQAFIDRFAHDKTCPDCGSKGPKGSICPHPEPMGDKYRV